MTLQNQLFTDIISGVAPVNPGIGGWDTLINQFMADRRGRHGMGLLGRILNLQADNDANGSILVTLPAGWQAFVLCVLVSRISVNPGVSEYEFKIGSLNREWNNDVDFTSLGSGNKEFLLVWPNPNQNAFVSPIAADVPFVKGDNAPDDSTFKVRRASGTIVPLNYFVYGIAWQTSDSSRGVDRPRSPPSPALIPGGRGPFFWT